MHPRDVLAPLAIAASMVSGCASTTSQEGPGAPEVTQSPPDTATDRNLGRSIEALRIYADTALKNGQAEDAVLYMREVSRRLPTSVPDAVGLGRAYLAAGRATSAREQFIIARELDPTSIPALEGLADAFLANQQLSETYRVLEEQASRTNLVEDHARIARYAEILGDIDRAEQALIVAARLDRGQSVERQMALADLYRRVGNAEKELYRLRTALFLAPGDEDISDRIRGLGEIPGPTAEIRPPERPAPQTAVMDDRTFATGDF